MSAIRVPLTVQKREISKNAKRLRKDGVIVGVLYGHEVENTPIQADYQTFRRAFEKATYSTIINLEVEGNTVPVLVQSVQYDPVYDTYTHVDFHAINMKKPITTNIPLNFIGDSQAVKEGGLLNIARNELNVTCLPGDLVHSIDVDITPLVDFNVTIYIQDIQIPENITLNDALEESVASVSLPRVEEEDPEEMEGGEGEEGVEGEEGEEGEAESEEKKEESAE
jgi:large subunit ribosomal protein L25